MVSSPRVTPPTNFQRDRSKQIDRIATHRAQHYVKEMEMFAAENQVESGVQLITVPGVGHSSSRLTEICAKAILIMGQRAK
ncbi:hypothetical protein Rcae01_00797 [Novipirellula caenicola]|uniref:Uncharacterized protein n=1 Tax=Novipirellula caenicola TaxID=1536901 RepID=A0ABP9VMF8_9BACT